MDSPSRIFVLNSEMITATGPTTEMNYLAAYPAGISGIKMSCELDHAFDGIKLGSVPEAIIPPLDKKLEPLGLTTRQRRLLRLCHDPLVELVNAFENKKPLPLFLAGPEQLPDKKPAMSGEFLNHLGQQTGLVFDKAMSRIFTTGRAAGLEAIDIAFRYFEATGEDYAIVGGVDTAADLHYLSNLSVEGRLLAEDVKDGFNPGEAACFMLVTSEKGYQQRQSDAIKHHAIYPPGIAYEPGHYYSDEPYLGEGLAKAFAQALKRSEIGDLQAVHTSMNGENYFAKELGVAMTRNQAAFADNVVITHPAEAFGDIGAAFAPVLISMVTSPRNTTTEASLIYCSSDGPTRAAMVVGRKM
ncbi:MAG: hypothetical protein AAGB12_05170 [Pseudomonadota bacterium]